MMKSTVKDRRQKLKLKNNRKSSIKRAFNDRVSRFLNSSSLFSAKSFSQRKKYLLDKNNKLIEEPTGTINQQDPLSALQSAATANPDSMMNSMKGTLVNNIFFPLQYAWINNIFPAIFVGKTPFPISKKFRELLQKGLSLNHISFSYISPQFLYFLFHLGIERLAEHLHFDCFLISNR